MAAEQIAAAGRRVVVFDAMPSVGRKFLLAGKGGLNLTHSEAFELFVARFGERSSALEPMLRAFGAEQLRSWAADLGITTFVGSSGRVFPAEMKAAPLLRAWLHRLRGQGVQFGMRHRWLGFEADSRLALAAPNGPTTVRPQATVLALGGASWPRLGSTGAWVEPLRERGIDVAPLQPSNCGFDVGWSDHFAQRFAGHPLKGVAIDFGDWRQAGNVDETATSTATSTAAVGAIDPVEAAIQRARANQKSCVVCGPRTEPDAIYYSSCGRYLPGNCGRCGVPVELVGSRFCSGCGEQLAAA